MYCREACARGKPDKCRGSCGENGWEVEFNSVNHRGFSNRPSIDSVYGVSIYCKDCGVGFYGDMRNEIYEQEPDRGESKELRAEEFGAEDFGAESWNYYVPDKTQKQYETDIKRFKKIARKYGFKAYFMGDGRVLLPTRMILQAKNTDGEWTDWFTVNLDSGKLRVIGNTDHLNLWFYRTRRDMTPRKLVRFVKEINAFITSVKPHVLVRHLIDPEDYQELKGTPNDAYDDERYFMGAEELGAEQTLYWSHKRNKECSYCGHGKNHKAALLSDDGKLFGCYKCNSYPNEEEMVADYEAEEFEAQQFYENCSDNQFEIFGRKLYYKCRNVGSVMNQKISGFRDGGLGSYKGGQYALRLAGGMKKYDIMNTLAEVSNDMKPNTMADWRGVVSATNQIISVKNAEEWGAEEFEAFDFLTYCGPCENYTTHYFREEFCDVCNNKYNNEELHSEGLEAQRGLGVK